MAMNTFRIRLNGIGRGSVEMNGQSLRGVYSLSVDSELDEPTRVTIGLLAGEVDIETEASMGEAN